MRAPTIPEAHVAAVAALTLALAVIVTAGALLVGPPIAWQLAAPFVLVPMGGWLRWAWLSVQLQRRIVAAYTERTRRAANRGATTPEDVRRALGLPGRPAGRPVDQEGQAK